MRRGTIVEFRGSWLSGLATLIIHNDEGEREIVPCENAATVRALEAAFGDVIGPGHTVNAEAIVGRKILYSTDPIGVLEGFTPVEG